MELKWHAKWLPVVGPFETQIIHKEYQNESSLLQPQHSRAEGRVWSLKDGTRRTSSPCESKAAQHYEYFGKLSDQAANHCRNKKASTGHVGEISTGCGYRSTGPDLLEVNLRLCICPDRWVGFFFQRSSDHSFVRDFQSGIQTTFKQGFYYRWKQIIRARNAGATKLSCHRSRFFIRRTPANQVTIWQSLD